MKLSIYVLEDNLNAKEKEEASATERGIDLELMSVFDFEWDFLRDGKYTKHSQERKTAKSLKM